MRKKAIRMFLVFALLGIIVGCADTSDFGTTLKKAKAGDHDAQTNLGRMYEDGDGVAQDYKKALEWYTKAADQGEAAAQNNLGFMYEKGDGVPQNYKKAIEWYTKAAGQGDIWAQYKLGAIYYNGQFVERDYVQAYKWFNLAAAQGDEDARKSKEILLKKMTPAQIAEGQRLSSDPIEQTQSNETVSSPMSFWKKLKTMKEKWFVRLKRT